LHWVVMRRTNGGTAGVPLSPEYGPSTSFTPSNVYDADTYYDVTLQARDSKGHLGSKTVRVDPQTVPITLASSPAGVPLSYRSFPAAAAPFPGSVTVGVAMQLNAPATYSKDGVNYVFTKWSDNGAASHWATAPSAAATYTATFDGLPTASGSSDKTAGVLPLS